MAEFETVRRAGAGVRTAEIDEGLRAHMNKVYGTDGRGHADHGARGLGGRRPRGLGSTPTAYAVGPDHT